MMLYERVQLAESILAEPPNSLDAESRDPGDPALLRNGTGATLPEMLHLSIERGIKALIEAFGRPGTIREHSLGKLLALLGRGSDEGRNAVFYLGRSFDSAVHLYGLLRGRGDCSRFESIQKYFRSTGRDEHYQDYRYSHPSMHSDVEELINSAWYRIDLRLHLEIVKTLMYSAHYFEYSLEPDVQYNPPPQMLESRIVGSYYRAFRAAQLPQNGDVSTPDHTFWPEHRDWLRVAVSVNHRGEFNEDSPQKRAVRALEEESKYDIALRYQLDLWRRREPDPEELGPCLADGYVLSDDSNINAFVQIRNGTLLGSVWHRSDGLWDANPLCTRHKSILSSKEHAIRFVVERSTQFTHVFVNGQPLGEMCTVRYMGYDFKYVEGYPFGWDGTSYRVEFLESRQFSMGDDLAFGFKDKAKDKDEIEGIEGRIVEMDGHVVRISDLWAMEWEGPSLRRLHGIQFPS